MKQLDLFERDYVDIVKCHTNIDEIRTCVGDVEWIKAHSSKINLSAKDIIDKAILANKLPIERCPQYYCSPFWGEATGNFKWRYMVVRGKDKRLFLVFLRLIGIMYKQQYFSISYDILPFDGIRDGVDVIEQLILNIPCVKSIERITECDFSECSNANFYCDKANALVMNKNHRSKYKRALSLLDSGLEINFLSRSNYDQFIMQTEELYTEFKKRRFSFNEKASQRLLSLALEKPQYCFAFGFYINKKLIGVQIGCNDFMNCVSIHFAKDVTSFDAAAIQEYANIDETIARKIKNFFGTYEEEYVKRKVLIDMGYDAIFVDGFHVANPQAMIRHKKCFYPKCVLYKIEEKKNV